MVAATKKEKIYNRIGILLHSLGFKKCIACINNENTFNTRNATYFYNRLIIFKWNALTCFKNRFETSKKLSQLILKTYSDRKNEKKFTLPILICATSYGNDVLGNSLLEIEKNKIKLDNIIFVSYGGLTTNRTVDCFINQIKNDNKLILCLAPLDPMANGFDVTNHSNEKDNIFFGYTPTSDRNIIISKAKQLKLEKNICELIIWTFQNNKTTPILHQHLKQTFFNTSIFNIINNFEKFNNGLKTNILMIEKDNPNLPKLIKIINNNTTPQPKL